MNLKLKTPVVATAISISFGLVVLLGYYFNIDADGNITLLGILRNFLLQGAMILASVALLIGILNLANVHVQKIQHGPGRGYSAILIFSFIITLGIGIYDISKAYLSQEPNAQKILWIFRNIQLPIEISLMAVLVVSLTYAAARLFTRRLSTLPIVFVSVMLVVLVGAVPQFRTQIPMLGDIRSWIIRVPATGGARGILLGVALGIIATGVRVLTGNDRPYED